MARFYKLQSVLDPKSTGQLSRGMVEEFFGLKGFLDYEEVSLLEEEQIKLRYKLEQ